MSMPDHRKEVRLAGAAFQAALAGKWRSAERFVKRISDECGGEGMNTALLAWCDTMADHANGGLPPAKRVNMALVNADTGQLDQLGTDAVPAKHQWAARLVAARAAMDHDAFAALIEELPQDALEMSRYIFAVLEGVAHTVNGLPRGYARMGGG